MMMIWMNHMVKDQPLPVSEIVNSIDRKMIIERYGLDVPSDYKNMINARVKGFSDIVDSLRKNPAYKMHDLTTMRLKVIGMKWNAGDNLEGLAFIDIYKYGAMSVTEKVAFQKKANIQWRAAQKVRMEAAAAVRATIPTNVFNTKPASRLFELTNNRQVALVYIIPRLTRPQLVAFSRAWVKFRRIENMQYFPVQNNFRVWKPSTYADAVIGATNRGYKKLRYQGEVYRTLRDSASVDKGQARGTDMDPYGGIDLTDQAAGMDVQGDAGSFRFDLSPAQIKALDQDVQGILPLIINVQPVSDVRMFLGFGKQASAAT